MGDPMQGGARVDAASSPRPRVATPAAPKVSRDYVAQAAAAVNTGTAVELTAAVIVAQALDRLGAAMIEAAAIGSYKRG